jgi:hypothetical protein
MPVRRAIEGYQVGRCRLADSQSDLTSASNGIQIKDCNQILALMDADTHTT